MIVNNSHTYKPRVMLIPDIISWILGTWALEIVQHRSADFDFVIFPESEINENPDLFLSVAREADVVHCMTEWVYSRVNPILRENNLDHLKKISSVHHLLDYKECFAADRIMVVCRKYYEELINRGIPEDKLRLIYNGVDTKSFRPGNKSFCRLHLGIPQKAFVIGFSGKKTSDKEGRKGIDIFLSALKGLPARIRKDLHVILTGPGWEDTVYCEEFKDISFKYFPFLASGRMPDFYNSLDLYLVTSRVEGGPVPLLEAMSCGIPVVSTPVGMVSEVIDDGVNGKMIPIDNIAEPVRIIEEMFHDRGLGKNMGMNGRKTILQKYTWEKTLSNVNDLYSFPLAERKETAHYFASERSRTSLNEKLIRRDKKRWNAKLRKKTRWYKQYLHIKDIGRGILPSCVWGGLKRIKSILTLKMKSQGVE